MQAMAADAMLSMQILRDPFEASENHVSYLNSEFLQRAGRAVRARPEQAPPTVEDLEAYRRVMEAEAEEDEPAPMPMPAPLPHLFVSGPTHAELHETQRVGAYKGPWYDRKNKRAIMLASEGRVLYGVFDTVAEEIAQKRTAAFAKGEMIDGNLNEGHYKSLLDAAMKLYHIKPRSPQEIIAEFTGLMQELADVENTRVVWNNKTEREVQDLVEELWRCNPVAAAAREEPVSFDVTAAYHAAFNAVRHREPQAYQTTAPRPERPAATIADVHAERLAEARQLLREPPDASLYTDHAIRTFDSRVQQRVRQRLADAEQLRRSAAESLHDAQRNVVNVMEQEARHMRNHQFYLQQHLSAGQARARHEVAEED